MSPTSDPRRLRVVSEIRKTCAAGATREGETSNPSYFSRNSRESRANNGLRFTFHEFGPLPM